MDVPHIIAGRFRIECEIGRGGMGTVYRATHLGLERPVAVKIIKTEFASDPHVTDRFLREARTMARLRHPHAAMIFDAGNLPDGRHFIVMEFVEGATLSDTLVREGRFTPERAVRIASDICDVLAEAHRLGIIHRDLKPSNIILNERGVCVLDFGIAKVLATSTSDTSDKSSTFVTTGSGAIVGTPRYMSPEQCMGQRVEARSDLYSLGILLYEMLAGRPPFVDPLASAVLVKQATSQPQPLTSLRPDVPRPLALAIHTLLAKQPENRPRSATAARALLEKSIARPERIMPEISPMATTVSTAGAGLGTARCVIFRALTPVMMIAVLGVLLFVWGSSGQSMLLPTAALENNTATASPDSLSTGAGAPVKIPQTISLDQARSVVDGLAHGSISDVRVVRKKGSAAAIISIHDEHRAGTTHLFMIERAGARFRITGRAPLDAGDFRGASWKAETLDADGDRFDDVLYTGTGAKGRATDYRLVLYVPRSRAAYWLRIENGSQGEKTLRAKWSPNALKRAAAPYRAVLQQHARMIADAR